MMNNKRTKAVLMAIPVVLSMFVFAPAASAAGHAVVSITTDAGAPLTGTDTVPIMVDDEGSNMCLGSGIINVTYNSSVVHVTGVATGTGNALPVINWNADNTAGWVKITSMDFLQPHNGSVIFANVTYKAVGNCGESSPLNITVNSLTDYNDYSQIPRTVSNGTFTILGVYTSGHDPAPRAINVPIDTDIVVHVKDDGEGVDQSTIVMTVEGFPVAPDITGTPADYTLTYDPPADFGYEQVVDVTIDASDLNTTPNVMPQDAYSFTAKAESVPTPVPGLSGIGLIAEVGILAVVLAISASATRKRRK